MAEAIQISMAEIELNELDEIKDFITTGIIPLFQQHSKLKMSYMNYFIRNGESDNTLINEMYNALLHSLKDMTIILGNDNKWYEPKNIVLLEHGVNIDNKYIKMLYGSQFQKLHPEFELPQDIIDRFNIIRYFIFSIIIIPSFYSCIV